MAANEARRLKPVTPQADPPPSAAATDAASTDERRPGRRWIVVLGVALVVALVLLVGQLRTSRALEARVNVLETQLSDARERLGAYDRHMQAVREGVGGVAAQLRSLEGLLEAGPGADSAAEVEDESASPAGD